MEPPEKTWKNFASFFSSPPRHPVFVLVYCITYTWKNHNEAIECQKYVRWYKNSSFYKTCLLPRPARPLLSGFQITNNVPFADCFSQEILLLQDCLRKNTDFFDFSIKGDCVAARVNNIQHPSAFLHLLCAMTVTLLTSLGAQLNLYFPFVYPASSRAGNLTAFLWLHDILSRYWFLYIIIQTVYSVLISL